MKRTVTPDGRIVSPMRRAESILTLGVVEARRGNLDEALGHGHEAFSIDRKSLPPLRLIASEMTDILRKKFPDDPASHDFQKLVDEPRSRPATVSAMPRASKPRPGGEGVPVLAGRSGRSAVGILVRYGDLP